MELLAPAGTLDCVYAAVNNGANAVYFAGQQFGARSFAGNLTDEEIYKAADYCHLRDARAYVTVNTLVYDREYRELEGFIKTLTRAGVDAVIVQDLGILKFIKELSPSLELHASTQMTVHAADGVRELERLGVSRVVLSRELSAPEIEKIISTTSAELEVFVHGAMCMSYSGQCLMSSVIGSRSGNRGKCAQPCRLPYSADGRNIRYYLSLMDMSLAEHIDSLERIGVSSLKIEGRMKGEEYVSAVVSTYRRLIDENRKPTKGEIDRLNSVFFRGGLTDAYYTGKPSKEMFAFDKPDNPYLKNTQKYERADALQMPTSVTAYFKDGDVPRISMRCGEHCAEYTGSVVLETAKNRASEKDGIKAQLSKTGGTAFRVERADVSLEGSPFIPVSVINDLRRGCVKALENKILESYRNKKLGTVPAFPQVEKKSSNKGSAYTCSVLNIEQYRAVKDFNPEWIYLPINIIEENTDELLGFEDRIVIGLPAILREPSRDAYRQRLENLKSLGFSRAEVSTIDAIPLTEGFFRHANQRMNITNSYALSVMDELKLNSVCLSAELNLAQVRDIQKLTATELIAYGRLPLMITENCIMKNIDKCECGGIGEIQDRMGASFPIIKDADLCRSVVLNSLPLYMGDKLKELKGTGVDYLKLMFTTESGEQCRKIFDAYINGQGCPPDEYTRLHYLKGALA